MTSKLTIEFMQNIISGHGFGVAPSAVKAMAEYIVAAMDSEPVAWISQSNLDALSRGHDALVKSTDNVVQPVPLYRHAQPAPVVPDGLLSMAASAIEDLLEHIDPNTSYYSGVWADVPGKLRAAMIAAAPQEVKP